MNDCQQKATEHMYTVRSREITQNQFTNIAIAIAMAIQEIPLVVPKASAPEK